MRCTHHFGPESRDALDHLGALVPQWAALVVELGLHGKDLS